MHRKRGAQGTHTEYSSSRLQETGRLSYTARTASWSLAQVTSSKLAGRPGLAAWQAKRESLRNPHKHDPWLEVLPDQVVQIISAQVR